ncbi:PREDICTED: trypsin-1-like [Nicrophorus vespilloides]|uniref:Trypsin-1-like n=1 Tax=Nicrophorus vespilloides TaxID=110193 RepID=A0ABM1NCF2_NICVS|nr:PREDICTED: trypsin-1-like [Nicrophorus vespilloides]
MFKLVLISALAALAAASPFTPRLDGRIVGGEAAEIEEYPYQLSLQYYGKHICGASIISKYFAVTAAHCTNGSPAESLAVRAASSIKGYGGQLIQVKSVLQNPKFDSYSLDFDITVLELTEPFVFGSNAQPIDLPQVNQETPGGSEAVVSGWGAIIEGGNSPSMLQAVHVDIISQEDCRVAYGENDVTDRMICAGVNGGGKDACQGDSGGPLVVNGQLVGIVSWGYGCARPESPGVYSSVANMRDYITENAGV